MKIPPAGLLAALMVFAGSAFAGAEWGTDYDKALARAASEKKMVLLDFTGSDWCPPCKKLDKETFSQTAFKDFAEKKLVLVELDFPNSKPQSPKVKQQNNELQAKYGIEGYPTLVLLDPSGKEIARRVGFFPGGPEAFIKWVENAK